MELTYECLDCRAVGRVASPESTEHATCPGCGRVRELRSDAIRGGELEACSGCGTADLYVQKDFPHGLGLGIVVAGFVVSSIFWYLYIPLAAYGVLILTAALDLALYYLVPDVTICYRCQGQHRGLGTNPGGRFASFDLAVGERYRQERLRVEELRHRDRAGGPAR